MDIGQHLKEHLILGVRPYNPTNVTITGGTINGTPIGNTTPAVGSFTALTATGAGTFGDTGSSGAARLRVKGDNGDTTGPQIYFDTLGNTYKLGMSSTGTERVYVKDGGGIERLAVTGAGIAAIGTLSATDSVTATKHGAGFRAVSGAGASKAGYIMTEGTTAGSVAKQGYFGVNAFSTDGSVDIKNTAGQGMTISQTTGEVGFTNGAAVTGTLGTTGDITVTKGSAYAFLNLKGASGNGGEIDFYDGTTKRGYIYSGPANNVVLGVSASTDVITLTSGLAAISGAVSATAPIKSAGGAADSGNNGHGLQVNNTGWGSNGGLCKIVSANSSQGLRFELNTASAGDFSTSTLLGTLNASALSLPAGLAVVGDVGLGKTVVAAGNTGAQTINKSTGQVRFAAAATTLVVTNSLCTTSSIIQLTFASTDATAAGLSYVAAAGSFTISLTAAPTAECAVNFTLTN